MGGIFDIDSTGKDLVLLFSPGKASQSINCTAADNFAANVL